MAGKLFVANIAATMNTSIKACMVWTAMLFCFSLIAKAQSIQTPFEKSRGSETATYFAAISFYNQLDKASPKVLVKEMGPTDAGYPLHLVLVSTDGKFAPATWHNQGKAVLMINNGIHPGEPDGIDACMMLVRDIVSGKQKLPANVCLGIIPVYNIGGSLNRGAHSRANQDGPKAYGFRGNSQYLDLNRDFTKCDSREAVSFNQIFHYLNPDILVDNHVSDGADYQHTMTLLTTQYDKLGSVLGNWLRFTFEPLLYQGMDKKGWPMCPYVDFANNDIRRGLEGFYDPPRYSSGYAALWQTIGFVPETHMLKPFKDRVMSTLALMQTLIETSGTKAKELKNKRQAERQKMMQDASKNTPMPLSWQLDTMNHRMVEFRGYESATKTSEVTGLPRLYYDHSKPYTRTVRFYDSYKALQYTMPPRFYVIPQGWHHVTDLLLANKVQMRRLTKDSLINVTALKIDSYRAATRPYENHFRLGEVKVREEQQVIKFLKGDWIISSQQNARRFLAEMLDPTGPDSYFAWNFFDPILQQKEGYSDYRWEDVAAQFLHENPAIRQELEAKKKAEPDFAKNSSAILNWVYKKSPYYELGHMRYPVYCIK
jgi:hypothetical protein